LVKIALTAKSTQWIALKYVSGQPTKILFAKKAVAFLKITATERPAELTHKITKLFIEGGDLQDNEVYEIKQVEYIVGGLKE
jgi:hypothetical protein